MNFELYDKNKKIENYNYWNILKKELELIKTHIKNLEYFNFNTNLILDKILEKKFEKNNKKLLLNTEYEQDLKEVLTLFKEYSTIKHKKCIIDFIYFIKNHLNIEINSMFYIINENNVNFQKLKENQELFNIDKVQIFLENEKNDFENIKEIIIKECLKKKMKKIIILRGDFLIDENNIINIINNNIKINIPSDFTEFLFDYNYETTNYRYNKYINFISSYNIKANSIINLESNEYNYYGLFPLLNKNERTKKKLLIEKFNYKRNKYIFQTLMVNLDRRKDRFNKFIKNYGDEYPNIIKFSAIDGKSFDFTRYKDLFDITEYNKNKNIKNPYQHHRYLKGVLGCSMSHYTIWNMIINNNTLKENDYILVLEDDIILTKDFNIKLNNLLDYAHFEEKWDVIYLGFTDYKNYNDKKINNILIEFSGDMRLNGGGTFAYLIRKKGARKYLEYAKKYKIQQAIDWFMIELFDKMCVYKCEPEIVFSAMANNIESDSDVQNLNEKFTF